MGKRSTEERLAEVAAIVVTHNSRAFLERCLGGLIGSVDDLIVVDNGSTDGSVETVRRLFPDARVIELLENRGFAAANNVGMQAALARYYLLVNPDAWPLGAAVDALVAFADQHERVGVVAPQLLNDDSTPQRSVFGYTDRGLVLAAWVGFPSAVSRLYIGWKRLRDLTPAGRRAADAHPSWREVPAGEFVRGAALLLRAAAVREVGAFDERFFMFSEETDLCRRMRKKGWSVALYRHARFVHVGGVSSTVDRDWRYVEHLRSYLRLIAKHRGVRRAEWARKVLVGTLAARALLARGDQRQRLKRSASALHSVDG
jgi:N-acetylglucosaminyl-diphospho-decaprenol L-rhamnosyltransferase